MNLTTEQIDVLEAGDALDRLIAEHVMGWTWVEREYNRRIFGENPPVYHCWVDKTAAKWHPLLITENGNYETDYTPPFSTDVSVAWEVVARFRFPNEMALLTVELGSQYIPSDLSYYDYHLRVLTCLLSDPNLPRTICKAALKAVLTF